MCSDSYRNYGCFEDYPARAGVNADLPALKFRRASDFSKEYLESFLDEQIGLLKFNRYYSLSVTRALPEYFI